MAYDPNQPIDLTGGGPAPAPGPAAAPWDIGKGFNDFGSWVGGGINSLLGIRDVPTNIGAPIDPASLGPSASYDFTRDMQAANAAQQQARQNQMGIAELIAARARGEGPSIAEMQLRQSTDRLQNQQAGMIASQRGMNPALQRRLIMGQAAQGQQAMNAQGALLRAQEQQAAQALAAQTYGNMRGQDQSMYNTGTQGGLQQSGILSGVEQANQDAAIRAEALRQKQAMDAGQRRGDALKATGEVIKDGVSLIAGVPDVGEFGAMASEAMQGNPYYKFAEGGVVPGYAQGGVPAWLSPGEAKIPPAIMGAPDAPERAARFVASGGGMVPGTPKEPGDSAKNDTVPAILPPGTGIVPRSVTQAPDAPDRAAAFIAMLKQEAARGSAENPQAFSMGGMAQGYSMGGMAQRPMASGLSYLLRNGSK